MRFLRQNTAVIITVSPFRDKTDGVTIEGSLTITNERITLIADTADGNAPTLVLDNITGATAATSNDLNYITGNDAGAMQIEFSAANTNRVGFMRLHIDDAANHVPVWEDFFVLPQAIYDWLTGVIVPLPANVTTIAGAAVSTSTAQLGVNAVQAGGTAWASGAITAASIADAAIDLATFAADAKTGSALKANVETVTNGAITAAAIANAAIDIATFAADCLTSGALKANVESITANAITATAINTGAITNAKFAAGAIDAAAIANAAIDNATFAADVGSTAYATNIIALAADKAILNYDAPTKTEMDTAFTEIKGATFAATDTLEAIRDRGDAAWDTATGFSTHSAADVKTAIEAGGGSIASILADTGELQTNQGNWLTATGFSTHSAADVWAVATRALTDKADFALSSDSRDAIWDQASGITLSFEALLSRTYEILAHKMNVTDATGIVALLGTDNTTPIATGAVTDNSTTTTRLELTWV